MKAIKIREGIFWVGAIDWNLRNFHGYLTQKGTSYNAYLVIDDKITLIDTVKSYLSSEMLQRISDVINPSEIDYIISNHTEMDHSGAIPDIIRIAPDVRVITSPNGEKGLRAHFKEDWNFKVKNTGDILNLGKRNLNFLLTPMVHWPDSMVSYMPEEKILFSNDAFGQHLASSERFDDEYPLNIMMEEAKKYYANIVLPYSKPVQKALVEAGKLDIELIANSHGIMWKKYISEIIEEYQKWSSNKTNKKSVIVYDTMWASTEKIARALQDTFEKKGYNTIIRNLQVNHISDIMTDIIDAEYVCVGSPTLNNNMMPSVAAFITYMKGLSPKERKAIAFGSYGWGGQSIKQISENLKDSGFEVIEEIKVKYIPSEEELTNIKENLSEKVG